MDGGSFFHAEDCEFSHTPVRRESRYLFYGAYYSEYLYISQ